MTDSTLAEKLARVKMVAMDVDGTFTDGTVFYDSNGEVIKGFSSRDGMGLELLKRIGVKRGFISGRKDTATEARANFLGADFYQPAIGDKSVTLKKLAGQYGISLEDCMYIGDDLNDLTALQAAGVAVVVANASPSVKRYADVVTAAAGGHGGVREAVDMILEAKGVDPVELWLTDKDTPVGMK